MNDLNKRYSEENLGLPLKVRMGKDKNNDNEDDEEY